MQKIALIIFGALLIAGSAVQIAAASEHHSRKAYPAPVVADEQLRNAIDAVDGRARTLCSTEPGNPYNPQTDYQGWSAFRASGQWDSQNDCQ